MELKVLATVANNLQQCFATDCLRTEEVFIFVETLCCHLLPNNMIVGCVVRLISELTVLTHCCCFSVKDHWLGRPQAARALC